MKYYLIAGEASGDLHGSNLIRGLRAEDPQATFRFWGGDKMLAAATDPASRGDNPSGGVAAHGLMNGRGPAAAAAAADKGEEPPHTYPSPLVHNYKEGAVMGLGDVLSKAGKLLRNISECKRDILSWNPDVVILIDYPGFNMKIARFCHKKGIRVFYYIAPKTWASREERNRKLKAWVDRLFIVFPFEIPYFESRGIPFIYKGNPLIDAVDAPDGRKSPEGRYIAILAGSRKGEISRMMPVCMQAADSLRQLPGWEDTRFIVAGAPSRTMDDYAEYLTGRDYIEVRFGETYPILRGALAAIINSGTASLEAALIGTPQVVGWSTGKVTAFIAKNILRVMDHISFISLGNLILSREAFREMIQEDFNPSNISNETRRLVEDNDYRSRMLSDYADIRKALGGSGASRAVAAEMIRCIREMD